MCKYHGTDPVSGRYKHCGTYPVFRTYNTVVPIVSRVYKYCSTDPASGRYEYLGTAPVSGTYNTVSLILCPELLLNMALEKLGID